MTPAVVDASVAVKWFVPEDGSDQADALAENGLVLLAPALLRTEVANAFAKKARRNLVTIDDAVKYLALLPRYFNEIVDSDDLLPAALRMAGEIAHPVYDCIYVEMARRREAVMVTDDRRLMTKLHGLEAARFVVHLSDWESALS